MIRVTRNDDIAFNVNDVRGKSDRYKITFYTVNNAVNIQKTDQDVTNGIITLNGSELMTLGEGVMNFRVDNIAPDAGYNDGVYNSSFTRTTKYYIVSGVIIPDGEDTETVIDLISELQNTVSTEITRSTNKDNAHDAALANVYTKTEIDDMLDDIDVDYTETDPTVPAWAKSPNKPTYTASEVGALPSSTVIPSSTSDLTNDSNFISDANYVHTDNNFTTTEKNKLAGIAAGAEVNVQADWRTNSSLSDSYIKNKPTKVSEFTNDAGYLTSYTETDPTVPAWAKQSTKPAYTASEVGALPSNTVIPSKTSQLTNDSSFISDANYNHTDNNFTTTEKTKLAGLSNYDDTALANRVTANETALANVYTKTQIDSKFTNVVSTDVSLFDGVDNYVVLSVSYDEPNECNTLLITDKYSGNSLLLPLAGGFILKSGVDYDSVLPANGTITLSPSEVNYIAPRVAAGNYTIALETVSNTAIMPTYNLYVNNSIGKNKLTSLAFPTGTLWENGDVPDVNEFDNDASLEWMLTFKRISTTKILASIKRYKS